MKKLLIILIILTSCHSKSEQINKQNDTITTISNYVAYTEPTELGRLVEVVPVKTKDYLTDDFINKTIVALFNETISQLNTYRQLIDSQNETIDNLIEQLDDCHSQRDHGFYQDLPNFPYGKVPLFDSIFIDSLSFYHAVPNSLIKNSIQIYTPYWIDTIKPIKPW